MDLFIFLAVLIAAAFHAGWNTLLKLKLEPMVATALVAAASRVVSAPVAVLLGPASLAAWPYILGSVAIHIVVEAVLTARGRARGSCAWRAERALGRGWPRARGRACRRHMRRGDVACLRTPAARRLQGASLVSFLQA
jgi:hypothetical protein